MRNLGGIFLHVFWWQYHKPMKGDNSPSKMASSVLSLVHIFDCVLVTWTIAHLVQGSAQWDLVTYNNHHF